MAAYRGAYHEDSDADDEYERSVIMSPALPPEFESSPTDSDPLSAEHTPTTYTHSGSHPSPTSPITQWTAEQCADFISNLGLAEYAEAFIDEGITGEALIALQHADLKDMGVTSLGHRLTLLKSVYEMKVKQNVPIEPDHYVPHSADAAAQDAAPTQDDIARIIRIIKERDERVYSAEAELRILREDLNRIAEENRKLREDILPLVRMAKDRSQPLPEPADHPAMSQPPEKTGSSLSRKFSTKKLFLGSTPKNPSPTIHEGRTLTDTSSLDPSAAALAASSNLTASMRDGLQPTSSPHQMQQHSPTSPAYSSSQLATASSAARSFSRNDALPSRSLHPTDDHSTWSSASTILPDSRGEVRSTPAPLSSRPLRPVPSADPTPDPPLSGGSAGSAMTAVPAPSLDSLPPPRTSTSTAATTPSERDRERERDRSASGGGGGGGGNPQVEIFKSFRVSIDDPCHKVLPVALKKYNITADWRQYALYIVHGDQERCLGLNERPLILFKQLDREGRKPMFMLRKHASPEVGVTSTVGGAGVPDAGGGGRGVMVPGGVL